MGWGGGGGGWGGGGGYRPLESIDCTFAGWEGECFPFKFCSWTVIFDSHIRILASRHDATTQIQRTVLMCILVCCTRRLIFSTQTCKIILV